MFEFWRWPLPSIFQPTSSPSVLMVPAKQLRSPVRVCVPLLASLPLSAPPLVSSTVYDTSPTVLPRPWRRNTKSRWPNGQRRRIWTRSQVSLPRATRELATFKRCVYELQILDAVHFLTRSISFFHLELHLMATITSQFIIVKSSCLICDDDKACTSNSRAKQMISCERPDGIRGGSRIVRERDDMEITI